MDGTDQQATKPDAERAEGSPSAVPIPLHTLDLLPYGIIVLDRVGTVVYYNPREEKISGRRAAEVVGRNFFTDVAPCSAVREFRGRFEEIIKDPTRVADFDFVFPFPSGEREVRISISGFRDGRRHLGLVTIADETERRLVARRLAHQDRLRAVGETAASVAHNFNNLLTAIIGNAQLALTRVEDEVARRFVETAIAAARDGAALVGRVRGFSREVDGARLDRVDANALVEDAVAFARHSGADRGRVEVITEYSDEPLLATVDAVEIREVLLNIIRNAVDATTERGMVTVRTSRADERVSIEVVDTGSGIADDVRERIFEPFFSTKGDLGTGLGLATAFAAVRRHGGEIEVETAVGRGTTMRILLPSNAATEN